VCLVRIRGRLSEYPGHILGFNVGRVAECKQLLADAAPVETNLRERYHRVS